MNHLEKKWKALVHKVSYLKFDLDDKKEKMQSFEEEVTKKMSEKESPPSDADTQNTSPETGMQQHVNPTEPDNTPPQDAPGGDGEPVEKIIESTADKSGIPGFKKLWRQIALRAHPDRAGADAELIRQYKRAQEAWNNGEVEVLLDVAIELEIKVSEPTQEMIEALDTRARKMQEEISRYEGNVLWVWGHSDEGRQSLIIDELLKMRRMRRQ